jgi:alpha-tubulin suppressor-like RCC1 family protein
MTGVATAMSGHWHGCASKTDGSAWCWAESVDGNNSGQLGNGVLGGVTSLYQATRVQLNPGLEPGPLYLTEVSSLQTSSLGGYIVGTTCALTTLGTVYCWGSDGDGEIIPTGGASAQDEPYATQILSAAATPLAAITQVAVGRRHACALNEAGEVWCWGSNIGGALGNGTQTQSVYPVRSGSLSDVTEVIAGSDVSCALVGEGVDAGRVFCWGSTGSGQVGIGPPSMNTDGCINFCKVLPTRVRVSDSEYLEDVVDIAAGYLFNCAVKSDRSLWCWGDVTPQADYAAPRVVQATPITDVAKLTIQSGSIRTLSLNGEYALIQGSRAVATPNCGLLE